MEPSAPEAAPDDRNPAPLAWILSLLRKDKFALFSVLFLLALLFCAIFGPLLFTEPAMKVNLHMRNVAPFSLEQGWLYLLGSDTLGRSILARIIVASQNSLLIAGFAVGASLIIGTMLGLFAGIEEGWLGTAILRLGDVIMSFPSLLMGIIILYVLDPDPLNVVIVLAITRIPMFMRTVRGEVLEARERMFVTAARTMGASRRRIIFRHLLPVTLPTIVTLTTLEFSTMLLAESSLSFLGLGVQPPAMSWGLLVAEGRNYLVSAWWLSFWPGLIIMLTTIALTMLANWMRVVVDPQQRWRVESAGAANSEADR